MPRTNLGRTINAEANVAERVRRELRQRGWSPAYLAEAMTAAGCKIGTSSMYNLLDEAKPRRITLDEVVALAGVLGTTIEDLLTPVDIIDKRKAAELTDKLTKSMDTIVREAAAYVDTHAELLELAVFEADLHEFVMSQIDSEYYEHLDAIDGEDEDAYAQLEAELDEAPPDCPHPMLTFTRELTGEQVEVNITTMWRGLYKLKMAMIRQAYELASMTVEQDILAGRRVDDGER